jgi:hypothetical protein
VTNPPNGSSPSNTGLLTGAKAGIGVAILLFIIIVILVVFAWKKRQKKPPSLQRNPKSESQLDHATHPTQAELPLGGHHEKTELPAEIEKLHQPCELSGEYLPHSGPEPQELHSTERYEVDGQDIHKNN